MIDKRSGEVAYAVMSFGGFLGMGQSYHPLPWNVLEYNERQGGLRRRSRQRPPAKRPALRRKRHAGLVGWTIYPADRPLLWHSATGTLKQVDRYERGRLPGQERRPSHLSSLYEETFMNNNPNPNPLNPGTTPPKQP